MIKVNVFNHKLFSISLIIFTDKFKFFESIICLKVDITLSKTSFICNFSRFIKISSLETIIT